MFMKYRVRKTCGDAQIVSDIGGKMVVQWLWGKYSFEFQLNIEWQVYYVPGFHISHADSRYIAFEKVHWKKKVGKSWDTVSQPFPHPHISI